MRLLAKVTIGESTAKGDGLRALARRSGTIQTSCRASLYRPRRFLGTN
jgi:hypothetical protein